MRFSEYTQVLKIWDFLPLNEIPALVHRLQNIFATYTDDYRCRCKAKSFKGKLEVPLTWSKAVDIIQYKHLIQNIPSDGIVASRESGSYAENSKVSESLILMKFYALSLGVVKQLVSSCDGQELYLPFEVTDEERDIIIFQQSSFILGRSGTGKTTVLSTKLLQREQLYHLSWEGLHDSHIFSSVLRSKFRNSELDVKPGTSGILRQLFVTVSPKLCSAIKSHICQMRRLIGDGGTPVSIDSAEMNDMDDSVREFADLPDSFLDLDIKHYPLIITLQKLLMMLDGSVGNSFFTRFKELHHFQLDERGYWRFSAFHAFMRHKEVNFDRFATIYWPHFNEKLTKKLDPCMVFKEIISHIKGSVISGSFEDVLSQDMYISLSTIRSSTLSSKSRGAIFDIFLDYERKKCANGDFDISDFVTDIHKRLRVAGGYSGDKFDFVYVDEIQDLTMRQVALLKYLSFDANESFIFAGDTAQTIAQGIDFRFEDIRSLFYTEFLHTAGEREKQSSVCNMFHLRQNFRTHAGILNLGQSVIDLVYFFFPQSIDRLSPEISLIYGEAPVILESKDENAIISIFGSCDGERSNTYTGFGAEQVILVRDSSSKEEILPHIGKKALVLTILECKGLEFQDVLLYNFFGSSPLKHQWRVIYNYMESRCLLEHNISQRCFDVSKNNALCCELKHLYVAITRTRQRLWICETKDKYAKPMFDYWEKLCLVRSSELDDNLVHAMLVTSSKEEWGEQGRKLFREGNYEMATMCFERAGDVRREKWSRAAGLRAAGNRFLVSNHEMASRALTQAADIFEAIGQTDTAAQCYIELGDYEKAGFLYMEKCGESRLEEAGDCFFQARCWSLAAQMFGKVRNVSKCLAACSKGKLFDMGLKFIECWRKDEKSFDHSARIDEVQNSFLERCAFYYHEHNDKVKMMAFIRGFTSIEFIRGFLTDHGYLDEIMVIEDEYGNFKEAAEIARREGDILFESNMLEKMGHHEQAATLILFYVFANSLWSSGNRAWPPKSFTGRQSLLEKAALLSKKVSESFFESVCLEANILTENTSNLEKFSEFLHCARILKNSKAEFFAIHNILDLQLKSRPLEFYFQIDGGLATIDYDNVIPLCQLSPASMIQIWNIWKEMVVNVLTCFNSHEINLVHNTFQCRSFCLDFFGARKHESGKVIIHNSQACWIRETNCKYYRKIRESVCMEDGHFLAAARRYWNSELFSVGVEVKEKLEMLFEFVQSNSLHFFFQGFILLNSFLITRFLINLKQSNSQKFQYNLDINFVKNYFWESFFPIDWRRTMTKEMVQLRGSDAMKDMLKEVITENLIPHNGCLTCEQMGKIGMLLIGIGNFGDKLDAQISSCFPQGTAWHRCIEVLQGSKKPGFKQVSLVLALHDALKSTFNRWKWERDYISLDCFLYLVEHLIFLASYLYSKELYFTTRSSFLEGMNCVSWNFPKSSCLLSPTDRVLLDSGFEFAVNITSQLLSYKRDTSHWIQGSKLCVNEYMPLLVTRLVIIVGLVQLNCGRHFKLLKELLRGREIISELPRGFVKILQKANRNNFLHVFSDALEVVQDPLVIVGKQNMLQKVPTLNARHINMDIMGGQEQMLDVLFAKAGRRTKIDKIGVQSPSRNLPLHPENHYSQDISSSQSKNGSGCSNNEENISDNRVYKELLSILQFWKLEYKKFEVGDCVDPDTDAFKLQVQSLMERLLEILGDSIQVVLEGEVASEIKYLTDKLRQLSDILNLSGKERANITADLEKLLVDLDERMSKLQQLLDLPKLQSEAKAQLVKEHTSELKENLESRPNSPASKHQPEDIKVQLIKDEKASDLQENPDLPSPSEDPATKAVDDGKKKSSQSKHQKKKAKKSKGKKK